jgi:hypothetical protein
MPNVYQDFRYFHSLEKDLATGKYYISSNSPGNYRTTFLKKDGSGDRSELVYRAYDYRDGSVDGYTAIGDYVYIAYLGGYSLFLFWGKTPQGIILEDTSGNGYKYLYTNGSYSLYQLINDDNINRTDPYTYCFLEGTKISTPTGDVSVESLSIGDTVLTADGREVMVRWMGHETIRNGIAPSVHKAPVRISKGAFGNGLPHSDLYVTNAHAFLIDGHLVIASALVNGSTIDFVPFSEMPEKFTYWHIETENHELVVANGLAAETLAGAPERKDFDNYDQYIAMYGVDRIIQPMAYPRIKDPEQLPQSIIEQFGISTAHIDWDQLINDEATEVRLVQAQ